MPETVKNFEFGSQPAILKPEDLIGWHIAFFATGETIESDTYTNSKTGEPAIGYIVHSVAYNPDTKEVLFSDPIMPHVTWQVLLTKVAQRSLRKRQWIPFSLAEATGSGKKAGQRMFTPLPINDQEQLDVLYEHVTNYMVEEVGLGEDDALEEMQTVQMQSIENSSRAQLESGEIVDAEVVDSK